MKRKIISVLSVIILFVGLFSFREYYLGKTNKASGNYNSELLKVHFIDVGQGDSSFIELPNSETMLIDSGEAKYGDKLTEYISSLGYKSIDYVVATHADADHIGGMAKVFDDFEIENCYTSTVDADTKTYDRFLESVKNEGIELNYPKQNDFIINDGNLEIEVLGHDGKEKSSDTNNSSVVLEISYYEYDFLFTGDADFQTLLKYDLDEVEVLKVSHHGSRTGTSRKLLNVLSPEYAVISVAAKNRYSHPHEEVIRLLSGIKTYKTSESGTVIAQCDKNKLEFSTEK